MDLATSANIENNCYQRNQVKITYTISEIVPGNYEVCMEGRDLSILPQNCRKLSNFYFYVREADDIYIFNFKEIIYKI